MCREGIWISLGFFEDIFVPEYSLQQPSKFDTAEGLWFWEYSQDGGNDDSHQMYMEEGSEVRLRVKDVKLNTVPTVKQLRAQGTIPTQLIFCYYLDQSTDKQIKVLL